MERLGKGDSSRRSLHELSLTRGKKLLTTCHHIFADCGHAGLWLGWVSLLLSGLLCGAGIALPARLRPPEVAKRWRDDLRLCQRAGLQKEFNYDRLAGSAAIIVTLRPGLQQLLDSPTVIHVERSPQTDFRRSEARHRQPRRGLALRHRHSRPVVPEASPSSRRLEGEGGACYLRRSLAALGTSCCERPYLRAVILMSRALQSDG